MSAVGGQHIEQDPSPEEMTAPTKPSKLGSPVAEVSFAQQVDSISSAWLEDEQQESRLSASHCGSIRATVGDSEGQAWTVSAHPPPTHNATHHKHENPPAQSTKAAARMRDDFRIC